MEYWEIFRELISKFAAEFIITVGGIAVAALLGWIKTYRKAKHRIQEAEARVTRVKDGNHEREGKGIWLSKPLKQPARYDLMIRASKPIIVVGNLKGGVGKTTIATNLAAHYAIKCNERVLVIDADYQGSASSMIFATATRIPQSEQHDSAATKLFGGFGTAQSFVDLQKHTDQEGMVSNLNIWGIPAYYDLAQAENRLMVEWVIKAEREGSGVSRVGDRDIRYFLAELLHNKDVADGYDRVIIDAPPRLTCACVQAFCASTHLLIPTVLDGLSGEAVGAFVDQIKTLRDAGVWHVQM